ncbi:hypothetical protein F751_4192 [Auxenochlorella protothecoides]|uniref:Uncharacterized protein n=2 Tax=Auxenochlorella protothecoides TaxID=3075 RepID=A0A087SJN6_AUXPR|nr:hypothetical protein F751_4192 [Auxenochlorella protothecoides]KFM25940.1 hypothetical protein F751_4192 [Auxenochlorella protothecoides]
MTNRESWADAVDDEEVEGPSTLHSDSAGRPRYETREGWDESADVKRGVSRQRLDLTHGFHREIVKNQKLRSQYEQECREGMAKASDYQKRLESVAPPQDVENVTTAPRHRPETRVREGFAAYRPPPALGSQPKLDLDRNGKASASAQDVPEQESSAGGGGMDAAPAEPGAEAKPRRSRRGGRKRHPRRQEGGEAAAHERGAAGGHGDEGAAEAQTDETLASHAVADVGSEVTDSPGSAEEWLGGSAAAASGSEVGAAVSGPPPGVGAPPPEFKDDAAAAVPAGEGAGPAPASPRSAEAGGAAAPAAVQPRDPSQERGEAADLGAASALPGLQGVIDGTKLIDLKADEAKAGGDGRPQNCSIQ